MVPGLETRDGSLEDVTGSDCRRVRPEAFCTPRVPARSDQPYCVWKVGEGAAEVFGRTFWK